MNQVDHKLFEAGINAICQASSRIIPKHRIGIVEKVAHYYGVDLSDTLGKSRVLEIQKTRSISQYILREQGILLADIASIFNCHHSTVLSNVRSISGEITYNKQMEDEVNDIYKLIDFGKKLN